MRVLPSKRLLEDTEHTVNSIGGFEEEEKLMMQRTKSEADKESFPCYQNTYFNVRT